MFVIWYCTNNYGNNCHDSSIHCICQARACISDLVYNIKREREKERFLYERASFYLHLASSMARSIKTDDQDIALVNHQTDDGKLWRQKCQWHVNKVWKLRFFLVSALASTGAPLSWPLYFIELSSSLKRSIFWSKQRCIILSLL